MEKKILIIEDDQDNLDIMTYILEADGFEVVSSQISLSLDLIIELKPNLILLDNRLGDGFGHDLCVQLKNNPLTKHFPVIIVSAVNDLEELANSSGADAYLNKPFDLDNLLTLVQKFA